MFGLDQNEANIAEAERTTRQGKAIIVLTFVTIVLVGYTVTKFKHLSETPNLAIHVLLGNVIHNKHNCLSTRFRWSDL
jgi:hypothetical protein